MREFRILGPVEVLDEGERVDLGGPRQQAALLVLALNAGRRVTVDQLIDGLWGQRPPDAAVKTARAYVSRLRSALGATAIVADNGGHRLDLCGAQLDAVRFAELADQAGAALDDDVPVLAARLAEEALGLWRGPVAGEGAHLDGLMVETGQLENQYRRVQETQLDAWLALGRNDEVIGSCERLLKQEAHREGLWERLMLALYRSGRQADALATYQQARAAMIQQLGLEPGRALRDLEARILRHDVSWPEPAQSIGSLPTPVSSFVGRALELEALAELINDARLVTLIGVGGAGKTRLAIEAATRWRAACGAPAWLVDLASLTDPELVIHSVMQAVGVAEVAGASSLELLARRLKPRRALLLLDNCEHLLDACAALVLSLLESCSHLSVVATSRSPLAIPGEQIYIVPPLATPGSRTPRWRPELPAGYDAVRLFLERGREVRQTAPPSARELDVVVDLCRALDGLPLAIELAAARLRSMTVDEIAAGMADRFALLRQRRHRGPERHQTLAAAIDWSHALLDAEDQLLLARLSVFSGGFTAQAASAICAPGSAAMVMDALDRLVSASLIVAQPDGAATRYRLYETVREYARSRLADPDERADLAERHALHYCQLAEQAVTGFWGPEEHEWFERVDADYDNVRAALRWAKDTDASAGPEILARIAVALGQFWRLRGTLDEGAGWLSSALEHTSGESGLRSEMLIWLASIRLRQSDFDEARQLAEEGIRIARSLDNPGLVATGLHYLAGVHRMQSRFAEAIPLIEEQIELWTSIGDDVAAAWPLGTLGDIAVCEGHYEEAASFYERGFEVLRDHGPPSRVVGFLHSMAELAFATGDLERAERLSREALPVAERIGEFWHIGLLHQVLAWTARAQGHPEQSAEHAVAALRQAVDLQEMNAVTDAVETIGGIALDRNQPEHATLLLSAAAHLRTTTGIPMQTMFQRSITEADQTSAARLLGPATDAIRQRAMGLSLGELIDHAIATSGNAAEEAATAAE